MIRRVFGTEGSVKSYLARANSSLFCATEAAHRRRTLSQCMSETGVTTFGLRSFRLLRNARRAVDAEKRVYALEAIRHTLTAGILLRAGGRLT